MPSPTEPPRLLYLSNMVPGVPGGGEIMVYRHLRGLVQAGWRVTVSAPAVLVRQLPAGHGFDLDPLPLRKWWWPPVVPRWPVTQRWRARLWSRAVRSDPAWSKPAPDCVLTVLWGHASLTAADLARAWGVPLAVWMHDLFREMEMSPRQHRDCERLTRTVLARAARVWTVSQELAEDLIPLCPPDTVRPLTPVPEQGVEPPGGWAPRFRPGPVIAHAGAFHPYHVPYLVAVAAAASRLGGSLLVLTPPDNPALAQLRATGVPFRHQNAFGSAAEALRFLAAETSALTIMYPFELAPGRPRPVGFPSRLIEFSRLGLPILLAAPSENPLIRWGLRQQWPLLLERPDWNQLATLLAQLAHEPTWNVLATRMRGIATAVCDPAKIHRQFLEEMPRAHRIT
ncbi:MAG TPA: glycosyltransferase [Opitutaceae bacterium]|nr:glycosyltransferase [Opitutaceae bacterium]